MAFFLKKICKFECEVISKKQVNWVKQLFCECLLESNANDNFSNVLFMDNIKHTTN